MKVLIGMTRSDTVISGSFKHICQLGDHFNSLGAEVVYVLGGDGVAVQKLIDRGHRVISLPLLKRKVLPLHDTRVLWQLLRIIYREKPDICSWHTAKIGALGRLASTIARVRTYYVPHGVPFVRSSENSGYRFYEKLEKLLALTPAKIIGVCQFDADEYRRIGVSEERLLVIENGMPMVSGRAASSAFSESTFNESTFNENTLNKNTLNEPLHMITAARFEAQKDFSTLCKACQKLAANGRQVRLDIYGDGPDEERVKAMFNSLADCTGVSVNFLQFVDDFSEKLQQADVFVLSSHWEGLPRSIIEAMSCAKPVVASRVGGCDELIEPGVNGYLVAVKDADAMAAAIECYRQDPALIQRHGAASLRKFLAQYTLQSMLEKYTREYLDPQYFGARLNDSA